MTELISIIIPVYNVELYLEECVISVLNQTYSNIEVILVNDGSPDRCGIICDSLAQKDERIKVIHKENGGLSDARNIGLDNCTGKYIAFIDSDDIVHRQFIELLYQSLISNNSDVSFCSMYRFEESSELIGFKSNDCSSGAIVEKRFSSAEMCEHLGFSRLFYFEHIVACNKLFKKKVFTELRFPFGRVYEDELIIHHIYTAVSQVSFVNLSLYFYRNRGNSIVNSAESISVRSDVICEVVKERICLFESLGFKKAAAMSYFKLQRHNNTASHISFKEQLVILRTREIPFTSRLKSFFYYIKIL